MHYLNRAESEKKESYRDIKVWYTPKGIVGVADCCVSVIGHHWLDVLQGRAAKYPQTDRATRQ